MSRESQPVGYIKLELFGPVVQDGKTSRPLKITYAGKPKDLADMVASAMLDDDRFRKIIEEGVKKNKSINK